MGAPELLELLAFISQKGNEKLLVEIFDEIRMGLGVIEAKCLLDRMIDKVGILLDKGIPGGFLASQQPPISVFSFSVIILWLIRRSPPPVS